MDHIIINAYGHKYTLQKIADFLQNKDTTGFDERKNYHYDNIIEQLAELFGKNPEPSLYNKMLTFNLWVESSRHKFQNGSHKTVLPLNGNYGVQIIISGRNKLEVTAIVTTKKI